MSILYESYAKSPEAVITGQKKPTAMRIFLWNETATERMENKTVHVGTKILVRSALFQPVDGMMTIDGKRHIVHHRVDTGAWETIKDETTPSNSTDTLYTITNAGVHVFYAEFLGDAEYEGCRKAAKSFAR